MIGAAIIFTVLILASDTRFGDNLELRLGRIIGKIHPPVPATTPKTPDAAVIQSLQDQISALNLKAGFTKLKAPEEKG